MQDDNRLDVWILQTGEILPLRPEVKRLRSALLAQRLARRGHRVTWWASAFNHLRKEWEFPTDAEVWADDGIRIRALRGVGYSGNLSPMRWLDYRKVASKFRLAAVKAPRPDVIIASMPGYDMADEAVRYARSREVPILVDIRDQWPESFVDPLPAMLRPLGLAALSSETRMMRRCLAGADGLVSMCESLLDWGLRQANRSRHADDRVFYLGGRPPSAAAQPQSKALAAALARAKGRFLVAFIGTFARYHNPSVLIEAARHLRGEGFHFIIAGDGELGPSIARAAGDLDCVDLPGWLDQSDIDALLVRASVGACPTDPSVERPFFPNKVFAYLGAGLPVVSAFPGEIRSIIEGEGVGLHYDGVEGLVAALRRIKGDGDGRRRMSAAARALFAKRFDAGEIYDMYATHAEVIAGRGAVTGVGNVSS